MRAYLAPLLQPVSEAKVECQYCRRGDEQEEQHTINISTSATHFHQPGMSAYGASKEALAHLLGYGQTEYGSRGVRVRNLHLRHNYTALLEGHGMEKRLWPWDLRNWFSPFTSDGTLGAFIKDDLNMLWTELSLTMRQLNLMVMWQCGLLSDEATFLDGLLVEGLKEREVKFRRNSYLLKLSLVGKQAKEAARLGITRKAIPALHTNIAYRLCCSLAFSP